MGFYSYIAAMVFGDTSESIDEVISPRFFIVYIWGVWTNGDDRIINNKNCTRYDL